ncbi:hypothetical protein GGX14DRAFT_391517 [Mycena pura]|uniref:Uncharacterized protein n=1 Tax=Mycena pura TaxID=153505 RepID=A0AAD6YGF5_9AGAR|nr:hypothetical protein GGX14DRAFT_391517 [Mycena pura]
MTICELDQDQHESGTSGARTCTCSSGTGRARRRQALRRNRSAVLTAQVSNRRVQHAHVHAERLVPRLAEHLNLRLVRVVGLAAVVDVAAEVRKERRSIQIVFLGAPQQGDARGRWQRRLAPCGAEVEPLAERSTLALEYCRGGGRVSAKTTKSENGGTHGHRVRARSWRWMRSGRRRTPFLPLSADGQAFARGTLADCAGRQPTLKGRAVWISACRGPAAHALVHVPDTGTQLNLRFALVARLRWGCRPEFVNDVVAEVREKHAAAVEHPDLFLRVAHTQRAGAGCNVYKTVLLTPVTWSDHPRISRVPELALALPSHIFDSSLLVAASSG